MGFANFHPFFVHAPLVLVPTAAALVLLGWAIRKDGFDTAGLLVTLVAAASAVVTLTSGFLADGSFILSPAMRPIFETHRTSAIFVTVISSVAALLAIAEWRGWTSARQRWLRAALLVWATIGMFFVGHNGATLVYVHGAAVRAAAHQTNGMSR